jgi:hypothetical protein
VRRSAVRHNAVYARTIVACNAAPLRIFVGGKHVLAVCWEMTDGSLVARHERANVMPQQSGGAIITNSSNPPNRECRGL